MRLYQTISYILLLLLSGSSVFAQSSGFKPLRLDTVGYPPSSYKTKRDKIVNSQAFQMTYIGFPLFLAGALLKGSDRRLYDMRNSYIPTFHQTFDNYLQYTPAVAMVGLKAAGVEGRSSWGRMLVSDAFSTGIMAIAVNAIKYTAKVQRPANGSHNSFPSGHTATAFMTATMLHREYGLTRSPWYSVGGYTVATTTAIMRMMNNRHWLSDVMAGAGIGIISTNLGYFLADLIFKDKGLRHDLIDFSNFDYERPPSYIGMYLGYSFMPTHISLAPGLDMKVSPGANSGFEGAWFVNRNWGIGGKVSVVSLPLSAPSPSGDGINPEKQSQLSVLDAEPLDIISGYAGPYFSLPLTKRCAWMSRLLVGCNYRLANSIYAVSPETTGDAGRQKVAHTEHSYRLGFSTGTSIAYTVTPGMNIRAFVDYDLMPSSFNTSLLDGDKIVSRFGGNKTLQAITVGASFNIMLW